MTVDVNQRAFVSDIADEGRKTVGARGKRANRHPATAFNAGEGLVEVRLRIERRLDYIESAGCADEAVESHWTFDPWPPGDDRNLDVRSKVDGRAAARNEPWARNCNPSFKSAAQTPVSFKRNSNRPEWGRKGNAAVGDIERKVGQSERLVAWRRHQFVDLAPAHSSAPKSAAQPDASGDNPVDFEIPIQFQTSLDLCEFCNQIGSSGVADDQIANLLSAKADPIEVIGRLDSSPVELAFNEMFRDRASLDPNRD